MRQFTIVGNFLMILELALESRLEHSLKRIIPHPHQLSQEDAVFSHVVFGVGQEGILVVNNLVVVPRRLLEKNASSVEDSTVVSHLQTARREPGWQIQVSCKSVA